MKTRPLIDDNGLDPIGLMLGLGERSYHRFSSYTGVAGLARWADDRLDLLAVHTENPGQGEFREFIARAKEQFKTICVWHLYNPELESALGRYGFSPETELDGLGETLEGMRWDRPNVKPS